MPDTLIRRIAKLFKKHDRESGFRLLGEEVLVAYPANVPNPHISKIANDENLEINLLRLLNTTITFHLQDHSSLTFSVTYFPMDDHRFRIHFEQQGSAPDLNAELKEQSTKCFEHYLYDCHLTDHSSIQRAEGSEIYFVDVPY